MTSAPRRWLGFQGGAAAPWWSAAALIRLFEIMNSLDNRRRNSMVERRGANTNFQKPKGYCLSGAAALINSAATPPDKDNIREKAKDPVDEEKGWLQLSIGGHTYMSTNNKPEGNSGRSGGLVELDLLATDGIISTSSEQKTSTNVCIVDNSPTVHTFPHHNIHEFRAPPPRTQQLMMTPTSSSTSLFLQQYPGAGTSSTMFPQQEIINWGFRPMQQPIQQNINLSLVSAGSHFGPGPFPVLGCPGPSSIDFRVIHPPRRPHSVLWFSLQPSLNQ
ncbi:hypothetical protein RND71_002255 [Anisodus tanguticus]|uniref:Uncharacterized protein n=1 Tax=Anisodus tanguticus TaxID=243964 RepID=A0AAE1VRT1_9SOLA|nr:hypothetical protein RND71_002255 [Anisodus tanguticus]